MFTAGHIWSQLVTLVTLTDNQSVWVDGAADAVDAEVGVVGEAVLARDPAQRRVNLATRLGHSDELCKNNILVTGGHSWSHMVTAGQ